MLPSTIEPIEGHPVQTAGEVDDIDTTDCQPTTTEQDNKTARAVVENEPLEEPEAKKAKMSRSVNDFNTPEELKQALLSESEGGSCGRGLDCFLSSIKITKAANKSARTHAAKGKTAAVSVSDSETDPSSTDDLNDDEKTAAADEEHAVMVQYLDQKLDWILENYDTENTIPQDIEDEVSRLLVLKSYLVLDAVKDSTEATKFGFDHITDVASREFDCPIALISLVDLGRQWFVSNRGLPEDCKETPRKVCLDLLWADPIQSHLFFMVWFLFCCFLHLPLGSKTSCITEYWCIHFALT